MDAWIANHGEVVPEGGPWQYRLTLSPLLLETFAMSQEDESFGAPVSSRAEPGIDRMPLHDLGPRSDGSVIGSPVP